MEASFISKPLSQSECRIKITSQLLSESECRNLGCDLTQKTQTNKMAKAWHNADKHYLLFFHSLLMFGSKEFHMGWILFHIEFSFTCCMEKSLPKINKNLALNE